MASIFTFNVGNDAAWGNFVKTIQIGVKLTDILEFISDDKREILVQKYPDGKCYLWGAQVKKGPNEKTWDKMNPGDIVLGSRVSDLICAGRIVMTDDNENIARQVWGGQPNDEPFRLIFFIEKPILGKIPVAGLEDYLTRPLTFRRIDDGRTAALIQKFGSLDAFYEWFRSKAGGTIPPPPPEPTKDLSDTFQHFYDELSKSGFRFEIETVRSFIASLATKRFVILSGLSGSGKTQLAVQFGRWLGTDSQGESLYRVVPVRPDWTGAESLFGFEDALREPDEKGRRPWSVPPALEFMLRAFEDQEQPYLLVLDEMNLAHVERYFADALSGMESREDCIPNLRRQNGSWICADERRRCVAFPPNLFVVGTVNVDETTCMFSPKVLDRANTFEFRVKTNELDSRGSRPRDCAAGSKSDITGFLKLSCDDQWHTRHLHPNTEELAEALKRLHELLSNEGYEFGHRVFYEALRFSAIYSAAGNEDWRQALDRQVMQKILPRLHGSRRRLENVLRLLAEFCIKPGDVVQVKDASRDFPQVPADGLAQLQVSFDKLRRMHRDLLANQFTSFTG